MKFLVCFLVTIFNIFANDKETILLPSQKESINTKVYFYQDKSNNLSIKDVINKKFTLVKNKKHSNFGYLNTTLWLKLNLKSDVAKEYILDYGDFPPDYLEIYFVKTKILEQYSFFDKKEMKNFFNKDLHFPFILDPNTTLTVFIKINSITSIIAPLQIYEKKEFYKKMFLEYIFHTSFFTILFVFIVINFFLFLIIKKRYIFFYVVSVFCYFVFMLIFFGYSDKYLFVNNPEFSNILYYFSIALFYIFSSEFYISIIKYKNRFLIKNIRKYLYTSLILSTFIILISSNVFIEQNFLIIFMLAKIILLFCLLFILYKNIKFKSYFDSVYMVSFFKLSAIMLYLINTKFTFIDIETIELAIMLLFLLETIIISMLIGFRVRTIESKNALLKQINKKQKNLILENYKLSTFESILSILTHQLKQPTNIINSILFNITMRYEDDEFIQKKIKELESQVDYIDETIDNSFRYCSKQRVKKDINLYALLNNNLNLLSQRIEEGKIKYKIECENKDIKIRTYSKSLNQVILILINNAIDALNKSINDEKILLFKIYKDASNIVLSIKDNAGSNENLDISKIFNYGFSTKEKTQSGFGLYIAKQILSELNKEIVCEKHISGLEFKVIGQ